MLPDTGIKPEDLVFVSGIGCAARLPYYMNTYGIHGIHGRAPAIATGVALARPDLHVWVIGGDGDMLSIGGNHLIHALRRNVNLKILMFNNQIYGLTKGQYSPTSEIGKVTKSTPFGSLDQPFNPISVALGAEASFVARTHDMDRKHMIEMFQRANEHQGASFVEVYQNCNVFNDGAFDTILNKDARPNMLIDLQHGEPIRFGAERELGVMMNEFGEATIVDVADVGEDRHPRARRDTAPTRRSRSRCRASPTSRRRRRRSACSAPSSRPSYEDEMQRQLVEASAKGAARPRRAPPLRADLVGRLARARTAAVSVERAEDHAGARLGPEERRLLRHADADRSRRHASARPMTGRAQDRGARGALVDQRRDGARVVAVVPRRVREPGHDQRFDDRGVGGRDGRVLAGERGGPDVRARDREREAGGVDEAEPVLGAPCARSARRRPRA